MIKRPITGITISDIHLGHRLVPAAWIIFNLNQFIDQYVVDKGLDFLFIAGDLFDRLLEYPDPVIGEFTIFAHRLLKICHKEKTRLRILEGTPSHDRHQSSWFNTHKHLMSAAVDCRYVSGLEVEKVPDLGVSILYIPDEYRIDPNDTYNAALAAVKEAGLNQVDLAIMHGQFNYQLPPVATKIPRHNEAKYLDLVKHFIFIGHDHHHSTYSRIIAQGSFDRLAHGEEAPKGGVYFKIQENGEDVFLFLENVHAKKFITLNLRHKDAESSIKQIERKLKEIPEGSYIRLRAKKDHPLLLGLNAVSTRFPQYQFTKIDIEEEEKKILQKEKAAKKIRYTPITITPDNIEALLISEMKAHHELSEADIELAKMKLKEVS